MSLFRSRVVDVLEEDVGRPDCLCVLELVVESVPHAVQFLVDVDEGKILLDSLLDERDATQNGIDVVILPY